MVFAPSLAPDLGLKLDRAASVPLVRQIEAQLVEAILSGTLPPGTRLPATRSLAEALGVARLTVQEAFEQLAAEAFVTGRVGAGTFVAEQLPPAIARPRRAQLRRGGVVPAISREGEAYGRIATSLLPPADQPFATGVATRDPAFARAWRRAVAQHVLAPEELTYGDPQGLLRLRGAVSKHLATARLVEADADHLLVTAGAQQAVALAARILLDPGDQVLVEDPCYPGTLAALRARGARIVPVRVDAEGMCVAEGLARAPDVRAAFVTPSHQYPMGVVLSMRRRMELIAWATARGAWIVEDDYDGEFRYSGRPLAALHGLGASEHVVYVATASKAVAPGLRLGFAVLPRRVLGSFVAARFVADREPPHLHQAAFADVLESGELAAHLRRRRQAHLAARDVLLEALRPLCEMGGRVHAPEQGLHLVAELPPGVRAELVVADAARAGVVMRALSSLAIEARMPEALLLGFAGFAPGLIREAAQTLITTVRRLAPAKGR